MSRFYTDKSDIFDGFLYLKGDCVNHLKNTLRISTGDSVTVCDGEGTIYECTVDTIAKDSIRCLFSAPIPDVNEPDVRITIVQAIPKTGKMETVIQKCVELGVTAFIPIYTKYTVIRQDEKGDVNKLKRWGKIAEEAAKQCGRGIIPKVYEPRKFEDGIRLPDGAEGIIAYERQTGDTKDIIRQVRGDVYLLIGAEGGFSEEEVSKSIESGYKPITMGPRILRCETAGPALTAAIMYETGNWSNNKIYNKDEV